MLGSTVVLEVMLTIGKGYRKTSSQVLNIGYPVKNQHSMMSWGGGEGGRLTVV